MKHETKVLRDLQKLAQVKEQIRQHQVALKELEAQQELLVQTLKVQYPTGLEFQDQNVVGDLEFTRFERRDLDRQRLEKIARMYNIKLPMKTQVVNRWNLHYKLLEK